MSRPRKPARVQGRLALTGPVRITAAEGDGSPRRRFSLVAYTGEPLRVWGYDLPVVADLGSMDLTEQRVPILYDHCPDVDFVVGQSESLRVENGQLLAEGILTVPPDQGEGRVSYARRVVALADAGFVWQASIGADPARVDRVEAGQTVEVNGRTYTGPLQVARGLALREVSFVVLGADRRTRAVVARRRIRGGTSMTFEEWLLSLGFDSEAQAAMTDIQKANLQQLYNDEYGEGEEGDMGGEGDPPPPTAAAEGEEPPPPTNARGRRPAVQGGRRQDPVEDLRRRTATELERQQQVQAIAARYGSPEIEIAEGGNRRRVGLAAHAVAQGWDTTLTELEALRASRPTGPAIHVRSHDRDCTLQALSGALILRAGGRLDHPAYQRPQAIGLVPDWLRASINDADRNRLMEAAHRYSDLSATDLCREALRLDGREAPVGRSDMIRAAFSGSALTNLFTTNVNALLLSSYIEAEDTTGAWTSTTDVGDFKTQERIRVDVGPGLSKLPRGGEADHAKFADSAETYRIARYAQQFVVDEQDIIDDMLGALSDTPLRMGQAAARLRPDLVYAIMLANPTLTATARSLFNSTDGNLDTSAALAAATLRAAVAGMMLFRENGVNLNIRPTHLLVPPSLKHLAYELTNSSQILVARGGTTDTTVERGVLNALLADGLIPVSDARLENGVTDPASGTAYSGSATTWYMASTYAHTIEVAYLRGTGRAPRVRSFQLDRGKYGIGWDVSLDIGAKALDWKGLHKATA